MKEAFKAQNPLCEVTRFNITLSDVDPDVRNYLHMITWVLSRYEAPKEPDTSNTPHNPRCWE